jgi:outer membrane protein OmpA-like peptidoglycan-associated protein
MKKMSLLVIALIVALPGCCKKNEESSRPSKKTSVQKYMDVDVDIDDMDDEDLDGMDELTEEDIASFEFPEEEEEMMEEPEEIDFDAMMADLDENEDYSWIDAQSDDEFRKLYFSFNHYGVRDDQRASLHYDIEQVKQLIAEAGDVAQPVVVIEGHACQEGAPAYNLALSERRAKTVADLFVASGIDRTSIKVVGRGQECPVTEGRTRQERNPNRRVEVRVLYT